MKLAPLTAALGACVLMSTAGAAQFRSAASGVNVFVRVLHDGKPVTGLTANDFELADNGVKQTISAAALETSPIDLTLLLDTSGSIAGAALQRINEDIMALGRLLKPDDRLGLVAFADAVREVLPMREWRLQQGNVVLPAGGGTTFLHGLAAVLLRPSQAGRPHLIIVLTDGIDTSSFLTSRDVLDVAERSDAVLHVVLRRAAGPRRAPVTPASYAAHRFFVNMPDVAKAAGTTGGLMTVVDIAKPLPEVLTSAISDFRSSYQLWFSPQGVAAGGWHELAVRVKRGKYDVTARRGYFGASGR